MTLVAITTSDEGRGDDDCDDHTEDGVLRVAALVESASEHPVARAVTQAARDRGLEIVPDAVTDVVDVPGSGLSACVPGTGVVAVGKATWLTGSLGLAMPDDLADAASGHERQGRTVLAVGWEGRVRAVLAVSDAIRPTAAEAVTRLRALGLRPVLVTGDNPVTAAAVAAQVGIAPEDVRAGVLPEGKAAEVAALRARGPVAVVGDGVNDAPALAAADLGIAMGSGAEVALETAGVTLVRPDPALAATAVVLARATLRTIRQNLFWAFAYNVAALPVAAAGLLSPMIAGLAMAASSVIVVGNSLRLRGVTGAGSTMGR